MDWMWLWFGIAIVLLMIELSTVELVAIWFALAGLILGVISAIFPSLHIVWQTSIFVVISIALFVATRPFVKRFMQKKAGSETNLELIIGKKALVTETIDNERELGTVKINGLIWTARSCDDSIIEQEELVFVQSIQGNKLFVKKIQ